MKLTPKSTKLLNLIASWSLENSIGYWRWVKMMPPTTQIFFQRCPYLKRSLKRINELWYYMVMRNYQILTDEGRIPVSLSSLTCLSIQQFLQIRQYQRCLDQTHNFCSLIGLHLFPQFQAYHCHFGNGCSSSFHEFRTYGYG